MQLNCKFLGILAFSLQSILVQEANAQATVSVSKAWVRLPAPGGHMAALYLEATNASDRDETVDTVSVSGIESVQLHESFTDAKGMTRMRAANNVAIPAHKTLSLSPGGLHVMLHGLKGLKSGQTVQGQLRLKSGETVSFKAETRSAQD